MIHIKKYEKYNNTEFKKYFISELLDYLAIFKLIGITNGDTAEIHVLLVYIKKDNEIKEFKGGIESYKKPLWSIKNNILFQSDNIQDCIDIIPILLDTNKYNL